MEIASWRALDEKWHWPSNVCLTQPSERSPCSAGKTKPSSVLRADKDLGNWSNSDTFRKRSNELFVLHDSDSKLQNKSSLVGSQRMIRWFRLPFLSTDCGIVPFLEKLDILPGSRLSTGGKRPSLAKTTLLTFCHGMRDSQSSQTGTGFSSQIRCWPLKFQNLEALWYRLTKKSWKATFLT